MDKQFNMVNESISCPPVSASLKIDVDAKANAVATIGVAVNGTLVPPKIDTFALFTSGSDVSRLFCYNNYPCIF